MAARKRERGKMHTYSRVPAEARFCPAMLFIRNQHGSHNKDETVLMEDAQLGASVLAEFLCSTFDQDLRG
ncbi:hypothetical protein AVE30378_03375 [Achromobacter veterisilvae]|uniref:Uncharacterized protein n=1 Tax=Achromobacter veterisilvae TaxID=2069367 RepID=A0A446CN65_9BURK|nr:MULTISPECIES: hypothetical protein [Achromobacter]MCW0209340.1 hypothetical protein [Achromobacter sp.]SSW69195.1 hypothetical protein AVE30378_03375 [Achromobacter veterisilvae]